MKPIKVAIIAEQVLPYRCALYRALATWKELDVEVIFLDAWGYEKRYDPTMGVKIAWNPSVLRGFKHTFARNISPIRVRSGIDRTKLEMRLGLVGTIIFYLRTFFSKINPGLAIKLMRENFDAVIVENYSSFGSSLAIVASKLTSKKVFLRGEAVLRQDQSIILRIVKLLYLRSLFKIFDGFMYSCKNNEKYYLHYGVQSKPRVFVPSATNEDLFIHYKLSKHGDTKAVRAKLGIIPQSIVVLGVGRLVIRKNWLEALKAFAIAKLMEPRLAFLLVGDGPERDAIKRYICVNRIRDVMLIGYKVQDELAQYYIAADISILSSLYDPSPKVLNEALMFGLPMIVSDRVGTAGEICVDGVNGFVYRCGHVNEVAKALITLATEREKRQRFGAMSEELARKWSIEQGAERIIFQLKKITKLY